MRYAWITLFVLLLGCKESVGDEKPVVFHYNQHNSITSLDPAFAKSQNNIWAVNHIFSTLVQLDDNLEIIPSIAKSWHISDDALTYTFNLRDDVTFHLDKCIGQNDRYVTAYDVAYSYDRLIDTVLNSPGSWIFNGRVAEEQPFRAVDDTTFVLQLATPFAPALSLLTMQYTSIVPRECVEYYKEDFFKHPIGTGPFRLKRWLSTQGLFLERHDRFFDQSKGGVTNLDAIRTSFIGERSFAFLELVNRRLDFFTGLESSFIHTALDETGTLKATYADRIKFSKAPYLNFEYLGINPSASDAHPLLKEPAFRQALNYGIDRQVMLSTLRKNVGIPADAGVITKGLPAYDPDKVKGYYFDRDKALALLSQYESSLLQTPLVIHTSKDYLDLTTFIAKQWESLGLNIKIEVSESAVLRNAMRSEEVGLFRASWIADYPDGENFLSMFYSQNPAPPNYTRYTDPDFDELYLQSLTSASAEKRKSLYQEMDRKLIKDAPVVFLFYDEISHFMNKDITGISKNALNLLHVTGIHKEQ